MCLRIREDSSVRIVAIMMKKYSISKGICGSIPSTGYLSRA
jgi:hypothetical protein